MLAAGLSKHIFCASVEIAFLEHGLVMDNSARTDLFGVNRVAP